MKSILLLMLSLSFMVADEADTVYSVTAGTLNVRAGISVESDRIGKLHKGDIVVVTRKTGKSDRINSIRGEWFEILTEDGIHGYIFSGYLKKVDGKENVRFTNTITANAECKGEASFAVCASILQRRLLNAVDFVKIREDGVAVRLRSGRDFIYKPSAEIESSVFALKYFPSIDSVLLYMLGNDFCVYSLLRMSDGAIDTIIGEPFFSPSGRYMVVHAGDFELAGINNGLCVYQVNNGKIKKIYEDKGSVYNNLIWVTDSEFTVDQVLMINNAFYSSKHLYECMEGACVRK